MLNTTNVVVRKETNETHNTNIENNETAKIERIKEESKFVRFDVGSKFEKAVFASECHPFIYRLTDESDYSSDSPRNWRNWKAIHRTPIKVIQATVFAGNKYLVEYVEVGPEQKENYSEHNLLTFEFKPE